MTAVLDLALTILIAVLLLGGAFWILTAALSMFRVRDGISRISVFSPATGLGLPMIVVGAFLQHTRVDSFEPGMLLKTILTVVALIIVSSVASNVLARAAYLSGSEVDPRTAPQDLGRAPGQGAQEPRSEDR